MVDEQSETALFYAVRQKSYSNGYPQSIKTEVEPLHVVELLVNHGSDINHKDRHGIDVLSTACISDLIDVSRYLISKGADVNVKCYGKPLLYDIISRGRSRIARMLIDSGADVNTEVISNGGIKQTILEFTASCKETELVVHLIRNGADIMFRTSVNGEHEAVWMDYNVQLAVLETQPYNIKYLSDRIGINKRLMEERGEYINRELDSADLGI